MWMTFFESFPAIIERSGFFFVPILFIMAMLNFRRIWQSRRIRPFLLLLLTMMSAYMLLAHASARYLLIVVLIAGTLAGFGAEWLIKLLKVLRIEKFLSPTAWLWVIAGATILCSGLKLATHSRSFIGRDMMEVLLAEKSGKIVVFNAENKTGTKLGGLMEAVPAWEFHDHLSWESAVRAFVLHQTEDKDFYFFTRVPAEYRYADFRHWFRGRYYFFPFDLTAEKCEYKYRYFLLKFNKETGDGQQYGVPVDILASQLPDPLPLKENRDSWRTADIGKLAPVLLKNDALLNPANSFGTFAREKFRFRAINKVYPANFEAQYRNALGWLLDHRTFALKVDTGYAAPSLHPPVEWKQNRVSKEAPLTLMPQRICVPAGGEEELFFEGAVPAWRRGNDRMKIAVSRHKDRIGFSVTDKFLKTAVSAECQMIRHDIARLKDKPLSLLILEDQYSARLGLKKELPPILAKGSTVDVTIPESGAVNAIDKTRFPVWPDKRYDMVIINHIGDGFARPWTVPFIVDKLVENLNLMQQDIRQRYGDIPVALILPPMPPGGESQYPFSESFFISRMSHYNICSAVERMHRAGKLGDLLLVPLYLTPHPYNDYTIHNHKLQIYSGYNFTAKAQKKFASALGAYLTDMLIQQK